MFGVPNVARSFPRVFDEVRAWSNSGLISPVSEFDSVDNTLANILATIRMRLPRDVPVTELRGYTPFERVEDDLARAELTGKPCLTPGAIYEIKIEPGVIKARIRHPGLDLAETQAEDVEAELHDAIETILAPYWPA